MEHLLRFLSGYVTILVQGEQCERFLNLCRARNISIQELCCREEQEVTCEIAVRDFFILCPVRRKTGVHIHILAKRGMPFFMMHSRKRKAFFAGIVFCFILMLFLSGRIWNIHIEGNLRNTTSEILEFLETRGVVHGIAKGKVNCSDLAAAVRRQYPEITWVSARIEGTRLILTIQEEEVEEENVQEENADTEESPCNLSADVEGTIVRIVTRAGIPLVKQGDVLQKGDILVLGRLDILNDDQEVVRYEYVHADADIYVEHTLSYYREFPLEYTTEIAEGHTRTAYTLRIGNLFLSTGGKLQAGWRQNYEERRIQVTENLTFPVFPGKIIQQQIKEVTEVYSSEEAKTLAAAALRQYEEKLIQQGMQISGNHIKIETGSQSCTAKGTIDVIERTGKETPVEEQIIPADPSADPAYE